MRYRNPHALCHYRTRKNFAERIVAGRKSLARTPDNAGYVAALVARLADRENEVAFLRAALEREQETVKAAQGNVFALASELSEARKQSAVLDSGDGGRV